VESLLAAGRLAEARNLLEDAWGRFPRDPAFLVLLGRTHLDWPVVGRFRAWNLFEEAARLAPGDPEPRYWQMRVGLRLGGVDGERLARDAVFKVLELTPEYRDVWAQWERLYRGSGHRRHALALLRRFDDPPSDARRAALHIELEEYAAADSALDRLFARGADDPRLWALRAQVAFEAGRPEDGERAYWRAVGRSPVDSTDLLWQQVAAIASPDEEADYRVTDPGARPAFFRAFWARREPDLTTPANERLAEHFRRLRVARRDFALLFPASRFHRSAHTRALRAGFAPAIFQRLGEVTLTSGWIPGHSRLEDALQRAGVGVDVRDLPEPDSVTRYVKYGFDGRGLMYLRFGAPDERLISVGTGLDVEAWRYRVHGQDAYLAFARVTGGGGDFRGEGGGDFVLFPTSRAEAHNAAWMLERDASGLRADLPVQAWVAFFRSADPELARLGFLDVLVRPSGDTAAVAVWDLGDREVARVRGAPPLAVAVREGVYRFGADVHAHGRFGRLRETFETPALAPGWLAVSSLLVGVTEDSAPDRRALAALMPADRVIERAGRPLTLYAEVYDLPLDRGIARYDVTFAFEPLEGGRRVTFAFPRTTPGAVTIVERLVVQPGIVPPGRYRLTLHVKDRVLGLAARAVALEVTLR
jgi:tetratricopeptide (TPR) repeat protein